MNWQTAAACGRTTCGASEEEQIVCPRGVTLQRIAQGLGTTVDYLVGRTFDPETLSDADPRAMELVRIYHNLSSRGREQLEEFAQYLIRAEKRREAQGARKESV